MITREQHRQLAKAYQDEEAFWQTTSEWVAVGFAFLAGLAGLYAAFFVVVSVAKALGLG